MQNTLVPGDPAPWFATTTVGGKRLSFDGLAGRYVLLALLGSLSHPPCAEAMERLRRAGQDLFADTDRAVACVVLTAPDRAPGAREPAGEGPTVLLDSNLAISRRYGALGPAPGDGEPVYTPLALLLDTALRVLEVAPIDALERLLHRLAALPPPHEGAVPAPVLVVPGVFEPEFCRDLIARHAAGGSVPSGFMREVGGRTVEVHDPKFKVRRDHMVEDAPTQGLLGTRLSRFLVPMIRRAFQFTPTRIERYLIACYTAEEGGHFRAHRDNTTRGTAHRRFAVSINLNDGFEGGDLRFPEFGPRLYRAPPGGAVVFSCTLLHEATPVTAGRRYAFLPFLYDEEAARIREANRGFIGPAEDRPAAG
ncbi:2OG-Fe(II) oxygenase [Roseomonas sp. NAR14]|uniref:2OG-Fe(II) oxygenase n=1 Tax=Roseomonas acroporae TaxID=2937791 RepID=A0A9X2BWQ4_9PROT|nr:2OG-Fe(II) oxygenase [Roseomonas acroporae]MCK8785204.1 2OG-Fe(II) oxygenase [Roseomonas acroporae]